MRNARKIIWFESGQITPKQGSIWKDSVGQSLSMPEQHEHRHREGGIIGNIDDQVSHQDLEDCQPGLPEGRNHSEGNEGGSGYDDMPTLIGDATSSDDDATSDESAASTGSSSRTDTTTCRSCLPWPA